MSNWIDTKVCFSSTGYNLPDLKSLRRGILRAKKETPKGFPLRQDFVYKNMTNKNYDYTHSFIEYISKINKIEDNQYGFFIYQADLNFPRIELWNDLKLEKHLYIDYKYKALENKYDI